MAGLFDTIITPPQPAFSTGNWGKPDSINWAAPVMAAAGYAPNQQLQGQQPSQVPPAVPAPPSSLPLNVSMPLSQPQGAGPSPQLYSPPPTQPAPQQPAQPAPAQQPPQRGWPSSGQPWWAQYVGQPRG